VAAEINAPFLWHQAAGRPLITLKIAASLDGRQAARDRTSQWISSSASRSRVHLWRAAADAMLTGRGTLVDDLPRLTARPARDPYAGLRRRLETPENARPWPPQPARIVVDTHARAAQDDALIDHMAAVPGGPWIIACGSRAPRAALDRLAGRGIEAWVLPEEHGGAGVDLEALAGRIAARGWLEVMAECGPTLSNALLRARLVGRVRLIQAPLLLGGPWTWSREIGVETLAAGMRLDRLRVAGIGPDALVAGWTPEVARCLEAVVARAHGAPVARA
jgi:diaminohydroxyphosphoribosylaminopyrimidine deaminase/5-amino-6-(5-phosphoribosylamino)uracil reductase